ncbi:MAG: DUF3426 domain-containing protein [Pseudomonadota bacterium]
MIIEVKCPACGTVFALDKTTLKPDDPRVRCGECQTVFEVNSETIEETAERPFAETGVGWVVVSSRDAPADVDDEEVGARYVTANEAASWAELGAPGNDADVDAVAGGSESDAATVTDELDSATEGNTRSASAPPLVSAADRPVGDDLDSDTDGIAAAGDNDEGAAQADDEPQNEETLAFEAPPPPPLSVVDKPPPAGDDWQALLAEIDTLPDLEAATELDAGVDGAQGGAAPTADEADIDLTDGDDAHAELAAAHDHGRPDANEPADDALAGVGESSDIIDSGQAVLSDADDSSVDIAGAREDETGDDEFVLSLDVDSPLAGADTDADSDESAAEVPSEPEQDAPEPITGSGLPEPSDEEIMREFTVSASDFLPADDAFVEAVVDNFILEADDDALAVDTASALNQQINAEASGEAITDSQTDEQTPDTSGIFVSETRLPEHHAEASVPHADSDEAIFETAIGLANEAPTPTFWTRYGGLAAAVAALALMAQALHQYRSDLATVGWLNPLYGTIYGERLAPAWDIRDLCFEQRDASANETTMRVVGRVRNRADQPLPYPLVHVTLLSRFDDGARTTPLAHRLLPADRYLVGGSPAERIAPGASFDVEALLRDPGEQASGYELEVCFRRDDGQLACNSGC